MSRCTFSAPKSTRSATRNEAYHIIRDRCSDVFGLTDSLGLGTRVWSLTWPLDHEDRLRHWLLFCRLRCHYRGSLRVLPKTERSCEMRRRHRARSDRVDDRCPVPYWPGQFVANRHSLRWRNYRSGRCRRRSNWRSVSWSEQCLTTRSRRPTGVKAGVNEQFANEWGRNEPSAARLFRRTGIGVRFNVASLLVHDALQLALHRFERVVDHLVERLV